MITRLVLVITIMIVSLPGIAAVAAEEATPTAESATGPVAVVGQVTVANFEDLLVYPIPTIALLDITEDLPIETPGFSDRSGQILGYQTTDVLFGEEPGEYRIDLPIVPGGETMDVDGDGTPDGSIQVFQLIIASNIIGDSYLQQEEQTAGRRSILRDPLSGHFLEGSLLLHAIDGNQSFPTGFGADQQWFTADDDMSTIERGYTVIDLAADGTSSLDRSATPSMDARAVPAAASPDFSDQGILESFNSLIDQLNARYAFTEFRGIDWDATRELYLPRVEEADANQDFTAYYQILTELASGVQDAHVQVAPTDQPGIDAYIAQQQYLATQIGGTLGVSTSAISDPDQPNGPVDEIIVVTVGEDTPADQAEIVPGTEIISVNGLSVTERLAEIPDWYLGTFSTDEKRLANKSQILLRFPIGSEVTLEYQLPNATETTTGTFTADQYQTGVVSGTDSNETISYHLEDGYTVIRIGDFDSDFAAKIGMFEAALAFNAEQMEAGTSNGIILDVRGNGGGWDLLYMTMASYFFTPDNPEPHNVFDIYQYDDASGDLVKQFFPDYQFSSPDPALTYTGPLVVLIDQFCGSSCEFFAQTLQALGRAEVYGQFASEGAGGNVDRIQMPGGILFQYTVGRSYYAGTEQLNIEARGVIPDVRLPITLETLQPLFTGTDVVLSMTIAMLNAEATSAAATPSASPLASPVATPGG